MPVKRGDRERRNQRAALQRAKFNQDAAVPGSGIERAIHALELAARRGEDIEAREHELAIDEHIELSSAGGAGRGLLKLQRDPIAAARYRYAIRERALPKSVVEPEIVRGHPDPLRHRRIRRIDAAGR